MVIPSSCDEESEIYSFHCCKTIDCDPMGYSTVYFVAGVSEKPSASIFNPLKTKRRLLYLKTQFVPSSKHFISVIKTYQFML